MSPGSSHRLATLSPSLQQLRATGTAAADHKRSPLRPWLPRLPTQLLLRPRLMTRLSDWAPVTVLRGPRGHGKTTLLASWLEATPISTTGVLWLSADAASNEPSSFGAALRRTLAAAGLHRTGCGCSSGSPGFDCLQELLAAITGEGERIVLVIDDAWHIRADEILTALLSAAQRHRHFHLVVSGRGRHPIEALAAASLDVNVLTSSDLSLSVDEIVELAKTIGRPVSRVAATRIYDAVGGWLSAVRLMLNAESATDLPFELTTYYVRSALLCAVEGTTTSTEIMRWSLAERLDPRLLRDLGAQSPPVTLLDGLDELELPGLIDGIGADGTALPAYPVLIRDVFRTAYAERDPAGAEDFHRQLANWYMTHEGEGHDLYALRHAVAGRHWATAVDQWSQTGEALAAREPAALREALAQLPAEIVDAHAGIGVCLASLDALIAPDHDSSYPVTERSRREAATVTYVDGAQHLLERPAAALAALAPPELLYLGAGAVAGLRRAGRFEEAIALGARVDGRIGLRFAPIQRLAALHLQTAITQAALGEDEAAIEGYCASWDEARRSGADAISAHSAADLALTYALRGERRPASQWLSRFDDVCASAGIADQFLGIGARLARSLLSLDQLDRGATEAALESLPDDGEIGEIGEIGEMWPYLAYFRAQCALHYGDPSDALMQLNSLLEARSTSVPVGAALPAARLLASTRAELSMAVGQGPRAQSALVDTAARSNSQTSRLHLLAGELEEARASVARWLFNGATSVRTRLDLLLIDAVAALRMGEPEAAADRFAKAVQLRADAGILRTFATIDLAELVELERLSKRTLSTPDIVDLSSSRVVYSEPIVMVSLTKSESKLIAALEQTASRREMAVLLFVSLNTVKTQLVGLYRKLGTTSREETLMRIHQLGLAP